MIVRPADDDPVAPLKVRQGLEKRGVAGRKKRLRPAPIAKGVRHVAQRVRREKPLQRLPDRPRLEIGHRRPKGRKGGLLAGWAVHYSAAVP